MNKVKSAVQQRLLELCIELKCSAREFSKNIGMSPTYLASLNNDITSSVLNNISITYPNINIMWIINGEGEKFISDSNTDDSFELKRYKANYDELKKDYIKALEDIVRYKDRLEKYESSAKTDEAV